MLKYFWCYCKHQKLLDCIYDVRTIGKCQNYCDLKHHNKVTVFDRRSSRRSNMSRVNAGHSKNTSQHTSTDIIRVASEVLDSTRDYLPDKICRYLCVEENSMTVFVWYCPESFTGILVYTSVWRVPIDLILNWPSL